MKQGRLFQNKTNYSNAFHRLWAEYPNKAKKFEAYKALKRLNLDDEEAVFDLVQHIRLRKKTRQWQAGGGRFIPHLATFLNQRRWEDEIEVEKAPEARSTLSQAFSDAWDIRYKELYGTAKKPN